MKTITKTSEQAKRELEEREKQRKDDATCPECGRGDCRRYDTDLGFRRMRKKYICVCECEWRTEWRR